MINFKGLENAESFESFFSEAERELEKLNVSVSPSSFIRQNASRPQKETFVLKVTTTAINHAQNNFSGFDNFINQAKKI